MVVFLAAIALIPTALLAAIHLLPAQVWVALVPRSLWPSVSCRGMPVPLHVISVLGT